MGITSEDACFICDSKPATIDAVQSQIGDFVTLDVSGICYKIMKEKILQYPSSLLFRLLHYSQGSFWHKTNYLPDGIIYLAPNTYFVQRSPELFDIVLQCYATGKFHANRSYCKNAIAEELAFWGLNLVQTCDACFDDSHLEPINDKHDAFHENFLLNMIHTGGSLGQRAKSSKGAIVFDVLSLVFLVVATVSLILSTVPELKFCPDFKNMSIFENDTNVTEMKNTDVDDLPFVTNCTGLKVFGYIEMACMVWFTFEIIVRFCLSESVLKFFKSPMHIIDLLAIIPYYIELLMYAAASNRNSFRKARSTLLLLRVLRMIRIFRILKIARYSEDVKLLGVTFRSARKELCMLFIFLFIGLIIFSSVIYQIEKDEKDSGFTSIPASCWWGIVTLTTVGYGDVVTKTNLGKFIASLACVFGVLVMAFPISILVEHFMDAYKKRAKPVENKKKKSNGLARKISSKLPIISNKVAPLQIEHTKI